MFAILANEPAESSTNLDSDTITVVDDSGTLRYYQTYRLIVAKSGRKFCHAWYSLTHWRIT